MAKKCLFYCDHDHICTVTSEKCEDPNDENCPSHQPNDGYGMDDSEITDN